MIFIVVSGLSGCAARPAGLGSSGYGMEAAMLADGNVVSCGC